jgi:hypothetical protein
MTHAPDQAAEGDAGSASEEVASASPWRDLIWLALLRLGVSAGVGLLGIVALSDDDYARVTIAQRFAASPRLDPSGTSWLPFPFWVMGGAMKLLDSSIDVARLVAAAQAVAATWILFAAGRKWGFSEKRALVFAGLATFTPAVALLGSVTVPELPTAALALFAVVTATAPRRSATSDRTSLLAGALAMLAATLSRYETWPVALAVAAIVWKRQKSEGPWRRAAWAALLLFGPAWWIVHNRIAHGDALAFVRRVAGYRSALGQSPSSGVLAYLGGLFDGSPAAMAALALIVWALRRQPDRAASLEKLRRFRAWGSVAALIVAFLIAGGLAGGAPTHHPERAFLLVWLMATFMVVDLATFALHPAWIAVPFGLLVLDYRGMLADRGVERGMEERAGQQLRALVPRGERVFAATHDYGYFAIMAAFGRPQDVAVDSQDPRIKSTSTLLRDPWNAVVRMRAENASWLVAPSSVVFPLALQERMRDGPLVIYELRR